jgi:signal transduction histidine kinase
MLISTPFKLNDLPKLVGLVALYLLAAKLTLLLFGDTTVVEFLWISSGFALGVVLIGGNKYLPAVFLGCLLGYLLIGEPPGFSVAIALCHTASIYIGTEALKREGGLNSALLTPSDFLRILILAGSVSLILATGLELCGWFDVTRLREVHSFLQHWSGSLLGIIVTVSLTLVWSRLPREWASPFVAGEAALILGLATLVGQVVFVGSLNDSLGQIARGYWMFPFITWAAVRIGRHGTVSIVAMVAAQGLVGAALGLGFFSNDIPKTHLANYFFYTLSLAVVDMALATYISERKSALAAVKQSRDDLERQVATRTEELARQLAAMKTLNGKLENAQVQLLQSEKMASIGQLAAGVAHELNNPIGFVHSNLGTLENYLRDIFEIAAACETAASAAANPTDFARIAALKTEKDFDFVKTDIFQLMSESKDGLSRVKKIVQDLKDFSRVGETEWQWADIHHCLDSTLNIVWNELKYKCTVTKHYAESLPRIRCLPSQLNQVFMNLLLNAAQAIPDKGTISISTAQAGDDAIQICIHDSGAGIPAENLQRIFEPFFTTKPIGKGTGLGLSIVWGIVGKHHGKMDVSSTVGIGTTFTITLPVQQQDEIPP